MKQNLNHLFNQNIRIYGLGASYVWIDRRLNINCNLLEIPFIFPVTRQLNTTIFTRPSRAKLRSEQHRRLEETTTRTVKKK